MTKLRQKRMRIPIYSFNSVFTKSIIRSIKSFAVEIYTVDQNKDFIIAACRICQYLSKLNQDLIAFAVSKIIINRFKPLQIHNA